MLLSPLFMLLCSTPRLLQFHLRWSPGGSDGEVEADPPGCGSTYWRVQEVSPHIPPCGMCCTGFHSHSASLTGLRPWCGGACLAGRPPICASSAALYPHVQAILHSDPLLTVIWWFHSPPLRQCTPVHSVVGPKTWNGLPVDLRPLQNGACSQFHHLLKTVLFRLASVGSASE